MKRDGYNRQRKRILWGVLMYKRGVIFFAGVAVLAALLLAGSFAHGQMVSVKQFPGATVATKLTNAQNNGCLIASTVCVLTIEPELSIFTEGTLPSRCANCWWIDYRSQSLGVRQGVGAGNSLAAVGSVPSFPLLAPDGSLGAPSYAFASTPSTGCFYLSNQIRCGISGTLSLAIASGLVTAPSFCMDPTIANDVCFVRDAANIFAQRNGTTGQTWRLYNSFTDASNYERMGIIWNANVVQLFSECAGTGTCREMQVGTQGNQVLGFFTASFRRVNITATGQLALLVGISNDTVGFKHLRTQAGCATAASVGAVCDTTVTWTTAVGDANYTPFCNGFGVTSGVPALGAIVSKSSTTVVVRTIAITAVAAQFTNVYCSEVHD